MAELLHPLLIPSSWLVRGQYFPAQGSPQKVLGTTEIRADEEFPETLRVLGEVRDAEDPNSRPVATEFVLDLVAPGSVRFHMNSIPLGTVLVGSGSWNSEQLEFHYSSPDRRILGVESYAAVGPELLLTAGVMFADAVPVTWWLARMEKVR
ncbi:MAG: hypothetical protein N2447_09150 [Thermoanaerobaculum sp.]|nr:hypothetical protein [Thermoanaerobaculum sp.]